MADKLVTIRPSGQGGDYTSMSAAIAGEVALNPTLAVEFSIEGVWTATDASWTLTGFTGINPCTVIDRAVGYTVNAGRTSTTGFRVQISSYIRGITSYGNDGPGFQIDSGVNAIADCCIGIARNGGGIYVYGGAVRNCVGITYSPQTYRSGIVGNGVKTNCYAYSLAGNPYSSTLNMTSCAGHIAQGAILVAPFNTATFTSVTQWAEDLHLVAGSLLVGAGTALSADPVPLTHDADGNPFGSTWPIGAFQFGENTPPPLTPRSIIVSSPIIGQAGLIQGQTISPHGVVIGAPVMERVSLAQHQSLPGRAIASGSPVVSRTPLHQDQGLSSFGVIADSPSIGRSSLVQSQHLDAQGMNVGAPAFSPIRLVQINSIGCRELLCSLILIGRARIRQLQGESPASGDITVFMIGRPSAVAVQSKAPQLLVQGEQAGHFIFREGV